MNREQCCIKTNLLIIQKQKAWYRPLNYKTMAAANRIDFIKPLDGKTPMDLQPKMAKRDAPER